MEGAAAEAAEDAAPATEETEAYGLELKLMKTSLLLTLAAEATPAEAEPEVLLATEETAAPPTVRPPEAEVNEAPVMDARAPEAEAELLLEAAAGAVKEAAETVWPAAPQALESWAMAALSSSTSVWVTEGVSLRIQLKQPI